MSVDRPFNVYREQLSSHNHGLALWDPKPVENLYKQPGHVSIGDVGYLDDGAFMRMFNVTLPWNDPSNMLLGKPGEYELIKPRYLSNIRDNETREGEYCTPHLSKVDNIGANRHEDSLGQMYQCRAQHRGALLSLPHKGHRKDVIHKKVFENYIRDNVDNWFRWSKEMMLPVKHMEDLILVTGCTLVTSWAAAAFDGHVSMDSDATTISLEARKSDGGGAQFIWRNIRGNVEYHNSRFEPNVKEPLPQNQCVFIRGFRAKRTFFWTRAMRAAAEPLPDDPDDRREDEIQVTRIPDGSEYRDPLSGVLDYIIEKCCEDVSAAEDIIAIAHDDDLRFIEGVETLTADAVENFLRERKVPLLIENGAAILRDQAGNKPPVSDEKRSRFYEARSLFSSTFRRSSTPPPGVELSPRSPLRPSASPSPEPPILPSKPAGDAARPTSPDVPYRNLDSFDLGTQLSFAKYVKDIGREYRKQAIKLVSICRTFTQAQKQTCSSYEELRSVLQVVDDALCSAAEARKKTTKDADAKFLKATVALSAYEKKYHFKETVADTMAEAEEEDKLSSTILKRLKETWRPLKEEPTTVVEFFLHKSLPDKNPRVVKQVLSQSSDMKEILWNFSRFKDDRRLTLKDNPHFYKKLPTSAEEYNGQFRTDPIDTFHIDKISVLTDNPHLTSRLFIETTGEKRTFGNAWVPKEAIIFKDIYGKLEGENIIGSAIKNTPNLWCLKESSLCNAPWPSLSNRSSLGPTTITTPTTSATEVLLDDWREPILRMLRSSHNVKKNIRISDKVPACFSPVPFLPGPLPVSNCGIGCSFPTPHRPPLGIQLPRASQGLDSPPSYKTAPSTPLSTERPILPIPVININLAPPTDPAVNLSSSSLILPSLPPPISLSPLRPAIPTQTIHPLLGTSSRAESQKDSPWHDVSTRMPHSEKFKAEDSVGDPPNQSTDPEDEDKGLSKDASNSTPTSQTRKPKKQKWHQRILDRVMRGSSQQANASMPNLPSYSVSQ